jgi:hypothetical protein
MRLVEKELRKEAACGEELIEKAGYTELRDAAIDDEQDKGRGSCGVRRFGVADWIQLDNGPECFFAAV